MTATAIHLSGKQCRHDWPQFATGCVDAVSLRGPTKHVAASVALAIVLLGQAAVGSVKDGSFSDAAVTDVQSCLQPGDIEMSGPVGGRMADCMENLVTAWDLDRLIKAFRDKTDGTDNQWRSDYWGKWFTALAGGYTFQPTPTHRQLMDRAVKELIATQGADGNIGTFEGKLRLVGNYDVWGRQCVILGLVTHHDQTGDKSALDAACRELDCLINELEQKKTRLVDLGTMWKGLPPSVAVESGALLYQRTGLKKYRDFSERIVEEWNEPGRLAPKGLRLVEDALAGKPARDVGSPKSYEQLYCFIGICELYRATGNRRYLDAAIALAKNIRNEELFVTGTGSREELWFQGRTQQTGVTYLPAETCVTAHWMYFCWQLLRLTGDSAYADEMEMSLYNAILGALMPDGQWWAYHSSLMGERVPSWVAQTDAGLSCCVVSGSRALMLTPFWAAMQGGEGPVLNLYFPGKVKARTASGGNVLIEMETDYPRESVVRMTVKPVRSETFTLSLRIPAWSRETTLRINGQLVGVQPGTYAKIRRKWTEGDQVQLVFDMRARVLDAPDGNGQVAVQRGPIVLALDDRLTPPHKGAMAVLKRSSSLYVEATPDADAENKTGVWMAFSVPFVVNGDQCTLTMCDYASGGNRWSENNHFRTWLPQPLDLGTAYETGVTWNTVSGIWLTCRPESPDLQRERGVGLDDLALSSNGATATADSEYAKEPSGPKKVVDGAVARPWDFSNRWVSSLETPHPHWIEVKLQQPAKIGTIVVRFADPAGYPTSFQGLVRADGKDFTRVFDVVGYKNPHYFRQTIAPVNTDTFRLVVRASANPVYPNAAQISEIELYPPLPFAGPQWDGVKANRMVFLGNSITLHGPAESVHWAGNWGMAASAEEKDYVHIVVNSLARLTGRKPSMLVANIADFERNYATYDVESNFKKFFEFKPDIVVVAIGENVPALSSEQSKAKYKAGFLKLLQAIKNSGQPAILVRSCFWADSTKDEIMRQCCTAVGGVFVDVSSLGRNESNIARSERSFPHAGVAGHPGDNGMKAIADALLDAMTAKRR